MEEHWKELAPRVHCSDVPQELLAFLRAGDSSPRLARLQIYAGWPLLGWKLFIDHVTALFTCLQAHSLLWPMLARVLSLSGQRFMITKPWSGLYILCNLANDVESMIAPTLPRLEGHSASPSSSQSCSPEAREQALLAGRRSDDLHRCRVRVRTASRSPPRI